jgi:hypothetical protein
MAMLPHEQVLAYIEGTYTQDDIPRRKRLRDEDVRPFMLYWLQGRNPPYIGRAFRSLTGAAFSHHMVRSHVARLADQGYMPKQWSREQPNWLLEKGATMTAGRFMPKPVEAMPKGIVPPKRGRPKGSGKYGNRRGRPPGELYSKPEDMLRGAAAAPQGDGPLVVPFYQESATPPEGWQGTAPAGPPKPPQRRGKPTP